MSYYLMDHRWNDTPEGFSTDFLKSTCKQCADDEGNYDAENCKDQETFTELTNGDTIYKTSDDGMCWSQQTYERSLRKYLTNPLTRNDVHTSEHITMLNLLLNRELDKYDELYPEIRTHAIDGVLQEWRKNTSPDALMKHVYIMMNLMKMDKTRWGLGDMTDVEIDSRYKRYLVRKIANLLT